jgi:hypothetical protein
MNHDDDDIDGTMSLKDWLEILDNDIDEAAADLNNQRELDQLVMLLRQKADELAAIDVDPEEEIERDEEEALE